MKVIEKIKKFFSKEECKCSCIKDIENRFVEVAHEKIKKSEKK